MRGWLAAVVAVYAVLLGRADATAQAELPVDLELVLAVDISGSMDADEQTVQRAGYAQALTHPEMLRAIQTGVHGRIALAYVEWAGPEFRFLTIPWTVIETADDAGRFADAVADTPLRRFRGTSISGALEFAAPLFEANGFEGLRRVIDVSGDGANNMGAPVQAIRERVLEDGIVINGLPIMIKSWQGGFGNIADLDRYYADCVAGGPGSFVVPVQEVAQFPEAIRRKLLLEIAGAEPRLVPAAMPAQYGRSACLVGERPRRLWDP